MHIYYTGPLWSVDMVIDRIMLCGADNLLFSSFRFRCSVTNNPFIFYLKAEITFWTILKNLSSDLIVPKISFRFIRIRLLRWDNPFSRSTQKSTWKIVNKKNLQCVPFWDNKGQKPQNIDWKRKYLLLDFLRAYIR